MLYRTVKSVMQRRRKVLKARPDALVRHAAALMARKNVGAVLILDGERLVGILTERDVVFRVVARGLDADVTRIAEVMTPAPRTIDSQETFGYALFLMQQGGFRHLPVVENGKPIGIVSARTAMDPEIEEFISEAHRRDHYAKRAST